MAKKKGKKEGVFYAVGKDGEITDEDIVDEMLQNEEQIRKDLIRGGVLQRSSARIEGRMSIKEYAKTHLTDMDEPTRQRYLRQMMTYSSEDYTKHIDRYLELLGEPNEEDIEAVRRILEREEE